MPERADDERSGRPHGGGSGTRVEESQFTKVGARVDKAGLAPIAHHHGLTLEHDEEHIAHLALAHDVGAGRHVDDVEVAGDDPKVARRAEREERDIP